MLSASAGRVWGTSVIADVDKRFLGALQYRGNRRIGNFASPH